MPVYYLESSSLVKKYVAEIGTSWIIGLFRQNKPMPFYVARITHVEVLSALYRRKRIGSLTEQQLDKAVKRFERDFYKKLFKIEIEKAITNKASELVKNYPLRAYDAVQLAAALTANDERISIGASAITFVSADNDLNKAASAEGLQVENPNNYP